MIDVRDQLTQGSTTNPDEMVIGLAVHHSATLSKPGRTQAQEMATLMAIDRIHKQRFGLFAYHMAAFRSGRVYWCGDFNTQRAHVAQRNHELRGVVVIGDFTREIMTVGHFSALSAALSVLSDAFPGREIRGHGDWAVPSHPTVCPGMAYDWASLLDEEIDTMEPEIIRRAGSNVTYSWYNGAYHMNPTYEDRKAYAELFNIREEPSREVSEESLSWGKDRGLVKE